MATLIRKGGVGSGNWGHAGRPGKVGGSAKRNPDGTIRGNEVSLQGKLFGQGKYDRAVFTQDEKGFIEAAGYHDVVELSPIYRDMLKVHADCEWESCSDEDKRIALIAASLDFTWDGAQTFADLVDSLDIGDNDTEALNYLFEHLWGTLDESAVVNMWRLYPYAYNDDGLIYLYNDLDEYNRFETVMDFVDNVYTHKFSNGYVTRVLRINSDMAGINIEGEVKCHGAKAGYFGRSLSVSDYETDYVSTIRHDIFKLLPSYQGDGFGAEYYQFLENRYGERGISKIELDADLGVGGYAWARMGFDFRDSSSGEVFTK